MCVETIIKISDPTNRLSKKKLTEVSAYILEVCARIFTDKIFTDKMT